ncbi:MAG: AMP-dependent synthetase/ligase [Acidobacteriota bacterium]
MQDKQVLTVAEAFNQTARKFPDRPAQKFNPDLHNGDNNGNFTYRELQDRVEKIGCGLLALGLAAKERVAIMGNSNHYWTQADLALACCAAVSVTIYPTLSVHEVSYIVNDSQSKCLFVGNAEVLARIKPGLEHMPTLEHIIVMDLKYQGQDRIIGLGQLIELGEKSREQLMPEFEKRWQSVTLDDWYTILYTSGTTGQGKGVILTHGGAGGKMNGVKEYFDRNNMTITEEDVTICFLPLSHIFDRGSCQCLAIYRGACICYADNVATLLDDLQKYNPTWFNCVPRLYEKIFITFQQQMAQNPTKKKLFDWALGVGRKALAYRTDDRGRINMSPDFDLKSKLPMGLRIQFSLADKLFAKVRGLFGSRFRFSFSASAGIAPDLITFYYILGLAVVEGYGSTESFNACTLNPLTGCKPGKVGPPANGNFGRVAADGEYEISGAGVFIGYLNKSEETTESFTSDGWFKSGDLVEMDRDGYVKIVDRKKAIICLATGKNVAPAKIENLFSTSAYIEQIFVIGDERPCISALFVPNYNYFIEMFDREGIAYDKSKLKYSYSTGAPICIEVGDDFIAQPILQELIAQDVEAANERLENFEAIKIYEVIKRRFTEESDELTPTQKTKKRVILVNYKDLIDEMYDNGK